MASESGARPSPTLVFSPRSPPFAALAAANLSNVSLDLKPSDALPKDAQPTLTFPSGDELTGYPAILRYVAHHVASLGQTPQEPLHVALYPSDPVEAARADSLVDFAFTYIVPGPGLEPACASLNTYISARTLMAGHRPSLADVAVWGALQGTPAWLKLRRNVPHLTRWHDYVGGLPAMTAALEALAPRKAPQAGTSKSKASGSDVSKEGTTAVRKAAVDNGGSFDIDLPGAELGKVVTRFPPEPSGYLHIGHAKAALLNQEIANRFNGRMLVRFDDTNPSKEKDEYVENILDDIARLGLKYEKVTYTSDYFPQLVECAERLILAGHAYADDTPVEEMREQRMEGVESVRRNASVEENLRAWKEMLAGSDEGRRYCLRIKMDMTAANRALRDPVAFRCNANHHWRTGHTYKCYPTYDFACPMVDSLEGVTHALRTSEYKDREAQFYWMLKLEQSVWPGLPNVHIWDYARLSFIHTVLSKRKLTWFVEQGLVDGWGDPRMPTVQGMLRRGLQLPALREFIISQGASKNTTFQEWDKIWTMNKKVIDPVCPRHTAVEVGGRVPVRLSGGPDPPESVDVPRHNKYPPAGMKKQLRSTSLWLDQMDAQQLVEGEEVTLMAWGNAVVEKVLRDGDGTVTSVNARLHLEGDFKKTKLKLTWLAESEDCPTLELHHFGYLITKRKLEEEDAFEDYVNRDSRSVTMAIGDANLRIVPKGEVLQLERRGYYIVDVPFDSTHPEQPIVLFNIPDGRSKNMP